MLKRIKELRIEKGFSEEAIAEVLGVSCKMYCKMESGDTPIKASQLVKFCLFLIFHQTIFWSLLMSKENYLRNKKQQSIQQSE